MTLGIMQPYFMPYIGYWQLMAAVDTYVVYDDVNYIKGGWVARNNILLQGQPYRFTIELSGASPNRQFREVAIRDDFRKFLRMLQNGYGRAPYFAEVMPLMEQVCRFEDRTLGAFMQNSFRVILDYLDVPTRLVLSSNLRKDCSLHGSDKVKHICHVLGADTYLNAIGGQELYDKADFLAEGITLRFLQTNELTYEQGVTPFVPNLSIIDVLMHCGKAGTQQLLKEYTLV